MNWVICLLLMAKKNTGEDFWQKVTHDAAAYKPLFYPMQGALKKNVGISYDQFVKHAFDFYQQAMAKRIMLCQNLNG
jgi:hypothetical protein